MLQPGHRAAAIALDQPLASAAAQLAQVAAKNCEP
jgi:hypothetical protein